jgi:circadian clock protein KaiC
MTPPTSTQAPPPAPFATLPKTATGIDGLDDLTGGGLPRGRTTLISGGPGCGKTLFGLEFIARGAAEFEEPGVFVSFEESSEDLDRNVRSLGLDIAGLVKEGRVRIEHVRVERAEIEETGEYDLDGLFVRLGHAIDSVGAKRVVLDTIEAIFSGLGAHDILRAELRRLFRWLKERGVTSVVTAERHGNDWTRHGLEEYVSDCVILLDHRVAEQVSTRRLRVVKYRGSAHGTNEYPFVIDEDGIAVLPVTSLRLDHAAPEQRVSTGIPRLDAMLGGEGYFKGSTVMVTGTAGTGKTSIAAHFVDAACRRGERCLYVAFEESPSQLQRNMRSIGLDLSPWVESGQLKFQAVRSTRFGLESHLSAILKSVRTDRPELVVLDPMDSLLQAGAESDATSTLVRLIDHFKARGITGLLTNLTPGGSNPENSGAAVSSIVDTWILVRDLEYIGERNRLIYVLKARGIAHSNQLREFRLTERGIELLDVYTGPSGVLTGSARIAQEARERAESLVRRHEIESRERELERRRAAFEARLAALEREFEAEAEELVREIHEAHSRENVLGWDRAEMARFRGADAGSPGRSPNGGAPDGSAREPSR